MRGRVLWAETSLGSRRLAKWGSLNLGHLLDEREQAIAGDRLGQDLSVLVSVVPYFWQVRTEVWWSSEDSMWAYSK